MVLVQRSAPSHGLYNTTVIVRVVLNSGNTGIRGPVQLTPFPYMPGPGGSTPRSRVLSHVSALLLQGQLGILLLVLMDILGYYY